MPQRRGGQSPELEEERSALLIYWSIARIVVSALVERQLIAAGIGGFPLELYTHGGSRPELTVTIHLTENVRSYRLSGHALVV